MSDVATLLFSVNAGNAINVADPDDADNGMSGDELVQVALAGHGRLTLSSVAGLNFTFSDANGTGAGDGTADASMHFRGSLASVNAALNGLSYAANGFSGTDALTIVANDLGNFGAGSARTAVTTVSIVVVPQPRIFGSGFSDIERVRVGGEIAIRMYSSATELHIVAPAYGLIKVETDWGKATSATRFTATPQ